MCVYACTLGNNIRTLMFTDVKSGIILSAYSEQDELVPSLCYLFTFLAYMVLGFCKMCKMFVCFIKDNSHTHNQNMSKNVCFFYFMCY